MELSRYFQVVAGARYDYFNIDFHNNRTNENLGRQDAWCRHARLWFSNRSLRFRFIRATAFRICRVQGDQFSSLTATTQTLKPEKFTNYEVGAKWDAARSLVFTTAVYRLDRTNTTARDPNDPAQTVQTGSQRTTGYEFGVNGNLTGRWRTIGGYAYQDAYVTRATTAAAQGAQVALVPHHTSRFGTTTVSLHDSAWGLA